MEFSDDERNRGIYFLGKPRTGKTTALENQALNDIDAGHGIIFIDPHGQASHNILDRLPRHRIEDTCFIDFSDKQYMVGFRPMIEPHHLVTAFTGIFGERVSDRMKHYFHHGLQLIKENPHLSILDLPRVYYDKNFRDGLIDRNTDIATLHFWRDEYPSYSKQTNQDAPATIFNKIGQLAASEPVRRCLTQRHPKFDFETAMRFNQPVLINIAKGTI
jgi:hypothetical protein